MKCPHCEKEIMVKKLMCPHCKSIDLTLQCSGGDSWSCNSCAKWFLKRGDHWENSIRDESLKNHPWRHENVGPVEYKEVPL